ncbi:TOBE domain-containing protein [Undibacterium sp. Ji67W]|uniref:TOBE domain-containing protein n=1 Tax=Undibacterium sp. Ji67W TaxID=3413042 RepID=UPI003BF0B22E
MNQLTGLIAGVEAHGSVALVDVCVEGGLRLSATLLGHPDQLATWRPALPVKVLFKETEVALAKNLQGQISLRNRIPGVILAIEKGQILTRVVIAVQGLKDVAISSVITTRSATHLNLANGDTVEALVKSNEMTIQALSDTEISS